MIEKPYAAFGYLLIERTLLDEDSYIAEVTEAPKSTHFWVKGSFKNFNLTDNKEMPDFSTGTLLTPTDYYQGTFKHTAIGDTSLFCFHLQENQNDLPIITKLVLSANESVILPKGTKLFHCAGEMIVNGNTVSKPTQIRSAANELTITATTNCYGMIFG